MKIAMIVLASLCVPHVAFAKGPADDVAKLVDAQIAAWSKGTADGGDGASLYTRIARDGKSAWISFELYMKVDRTEDGVASFPERDYRVTELAVSTADGWKLAGGTWSQERDNATINKLAVAGKAPALARLASEVGDKSLREAFAAMIGAPLGATAGARKDLVVFGSGFGERTVGGAGFKKAWDAAWQGHLAIVGANIAHLAPSGTTGWVVANVELAKKAGKQSYKIPFRLVCVFDQDATGAWSLVHAHFAVAPT